MADLDTMFEPIYKRLREKYSGFMGEEITNEKMRIGDQNFEIPLPRFHNGGAKEMDTFFTEIEEECNNALGKFVKDNSRLHKIGRGYSRNKLRYTIRERYQIKKQLVRLYGDKNYYLKQMEQNRASFYARDSRLEVNFGNHLAKIGKLQKRRNDLVAKMKNDTKKYLQKKWHTKLSKMEGMNTRQA